MQFKNGYFKQLSWKKFDAQTEQDFKRDYNSKSVPVLRISLIIILIVGVIPYSYLDSLMIPESAKIAWLIRYGIWAPAILFAVFLTYRKVIVNYFQTVAFVINFILCYGVLVMIAISNKNELGYTAYYTGTLVTMSSVFMLRLRFKPTVVIISSVAVSYFLVAVFIQKLHIQYVINGTPVILINNLFFLFSVVLSIGIASYILEYHARLNYWQRQHILNEKNRVNKKNIKIGIQNEKIKKQNQEVKEIYATKNKLFSIIAHDLKAPFNSLIGFSDLIIESCENNDYERIDKYSQIIYNTSKKTLSLLDNLLDWSRLQTNKLKIYPENINIKTVVEGNIEFHSNAANQKEIGLLFNCRFDAFVKADMNMINTVIRNLISNALKFSYPNDNIEVIIIDKTDKIEVLVVDQGVGIIEEDVQKLFKLNTTISKIGTKNETGTGLGLVLCYNFIKLHKGNIWVKSKFGEGSTFGFELPK